jgi:predicted lipid-binding transport protein (Tim44 family)
MSIPTRRRAKLLFAVLASFVSISMLASIADARVGGGSSYGSRGSKTYTAPPTTNTAPKPAAPIQKSATQPGQQPPAAAGAASRFGSWRSILMGGLLAAAFASIFGFGALASALGFLLQFALIAGVVWVIVSYFRNRSAQPAMARANPSNGSRPAHVPAPRYAGGSMGAGSSALVVNSNDYDAFERLLGEIQLAYGRGDRRALAERVTPEMLSYFEEELDAHAERGVRNEIAEPRLLQGDLAEAWRESDGEYATVAMRFSILDATVEQASGRLISGSRTEPKEVTELWTFRRRPNDSSQHWQLSAIQQAAKRLPLAS